MSEWNEQQLSEDLQGVAWELRAARREPSELERDLLKQRVRRRAATPRGGALRRQAGVAFLTLSLVAGGGGMVIAAHGGSHGDGPGAARSQYCPEKSPRGPQPKPPPGPENACGFPNPGRESPPETGSANANSKGANANSNKRR